MDGDPYMSGTTAIELLTRLYIARNDHGKRVSIALAKDGEPTEFLPLTDSDLWYIIRCLGNAL